MVAAARERGIPVLGEYETGLAAAARARVRRGHRLQRQDDHRRADRPPAPRGRAAGEGRRQRRDGADLACRARSRPGTIVVAEASSFQLEDTEAFAPEAAVLLNLAEDHLDRHGTFEAYRAAKLEVFARQPNEAVAVAPLGLGVEDLGGCARRVCFGAGPGAELADRAGQLWWDEQPLLAVSELGPARRPQRPERDGGRRGLPRARGGPRRGRAPACARSRGLAHRLEEVATVDGVLYVNDSKATNVASALVGIDSFPGGVHAILGGRSKGGGFTELVPDGRRALPRRVPDRRDRRRAARGARARPASRCTTAATSSAPCSRRERRRRARRRRAALARLPVVRPVRELRAARRPLPGARPGPDELDINPARRREACGAGRRKQA